MSKDGKKPLGDSSVFQKGRKGAMRGEVRATIRCREICYFVGYILFSLDCY